jgi:histidinol phosphatase-like enzyme (inositol monophosphatase family)
MSRDPMREELAAALAAAEAARKVALRWFGRPMVVERKPDGSPVSAADRETEEAIRAVLRRAFPADGVVGEELGVERADAACRWIVDPIDGTRNFVRGIPLWGTLIARAEGDRLRVGVISLPALGTLLYATRGGGAFERREPLRVSTRRRLADAYVLHGGYEYRTARRGRFLLPAVAVRVATMRSLGDCQAYAWIARGKCEAMFEESLRPWDIAPIKLVIEEAGGRLTDWAGRDTWEGPTVLASNGRVHRELVGILAPFAAPSRAASARTSRRSRR